MPMANRRRRETPPAGAVNGRYAASPAGAGHTLAQRAAHLASCVRLGLDEPIAMQRLQDKVRGLRYAPGPDSLFHQVLDGALSLTNADLGNVQVVDPATGALRIVAHLGFGSEFLDYFAVVDDDNAACGRAARDCAQTTIADVTTDPGFAPHREIADASGFRAVLSTPLVDGAGRLVGMVSTHFRRPRRPADRDLRIMELYGDFAGEAITRLLRGPDASEEDAASRLLPPGGRIEHLRRLDLG